jgi:hypothetical protein
MEGILQQKTTQRDTARESLTVLLRVVLSAVIGEPAMLEDDV